MFITIFSSYPFEQRSGGPTKSTFRFNKNLKINRTQLYFYFKKTEDDTLWVLLKINNFFSDLYNRNEKNK